MAKRDTTAVTVVLIDPLARTVTSVEHDGSAGRSEQLVQTPFPSETHWGKDTLVYDENGEFRPDTGVFSLAGFPEPFLYGRVLLIGMCEGQMTTPTRGIEEVRQSVQWHDLTDPPERARIGIE